ncbi:signal peptidase I [Sphingomonas astaxanthinifaciens]|uniref:Signal peptidase I n=1 Tax=Sphingomonas astaxanthinifaciens DSM 22298 TaxID=1123267 RepID=A0ABQ5Z6K9_9SPHN|nr:signal peptidase I [Sphingomonas astaxanthinifaciens]GLR48400.1 signal peptidase I [Sphingomonas astaxanthinifaciens DSM 22298]
MATTELTREKSEKSADGSLRRGLLVLLLFAWVLRSLIIAPFSIPSGSMLPGLYIGDYLLVAKWPYGYSRASFLFGFPPISGRILASLPERGDVAVFRGPEGNDVIKRVIGLPGDTIATRDGQVILNGTPIARQRIAPVAIPLSANSPCRAVTPREAAGNCLYDAWRETLPEGRSFTVLDQVDNPVVDDFGPVKVPAGHVFMMGDNRDDSADSRISPALGGMGFVPEEALVGRALVTFWSTDGGAQWLLPWTWFGAARWDRIGMRH